MRSIPCEKTPVVVADYFDDSLDDARRQSLERHLDQCPHCRAEIESLEPVRARLQGWRRQPVPSWSRLRELNSPDRDHRGSPWARWLPAAACVVLVVLSAFNVQVSRDAAGFHVAFGALAPDGGGAVEIPAGDIREEVRDEMARRFALFEEEQRRARNEEFQSLLTRMEERQDRNNLRLMEVVLEQTHEATSQSLNQIISWVEEQRQADLLLVEDSYQRLVDSDYQTLMSMQQLANYVQSGTTP